MSRDTLFGGMWCSCAFWTGLILTVVLAWCFSLNCDKKSDVILKNAPQVCPISVVDIESLEVESLEVDKVLSKKLK